jgi:hypothetical protein
LTDGRPTDDVTPSVKRWQRHYAGKAHLVAITLGQRADIDLLNDLTADVLALEHNTDEEFRRFIDWISTSVAMQSHALETPTTGGLSLDKNRPTGLTLVKDKPKPMAGGLDDNVVTLPGRCQASRRPYLIKYVKKGELDASVAQLYRVADYQLDGAYPIDESYFIWSGEDTTDAMVSTERLTGAPPCPHCGNATAFAMCDCGHLLCINGPGPFECPWCGRHGKFGAGGNTAFDVLRGRG